jgi:hypothetical protein
MAMTYPARRPYQPKLMPVADPAANPVIRVLRTGQNLASQG